MFMLIIWQKKLFKLKDSLKCQKTIDFWQHGRWQSYKITLTLWNCQAKEEYYDSNLTLNGHKKFEAYLNLGPTVKISWIKSSTQMMLESFLPETRKPNINNNSLQVSLDPALKSNVCKIY